jgi:hypothetical protein
VFMENDPYQSYIINDSSIIIGIALMFPRSLSLSKSQKSKEA